MLSNIYRESLSRIHSGVDLPLQCNGMTPWKVPLSITSRVQSRQHMHDLIPVALSLHHHHLTTNLPPRIQCTLSLLMLLPGINHPQQIQSDAYRWDAQCALEGGWQGVPLKSKCWISILSYPWHSLYLGEQTFMLQEMATFTTVTQNALVTIQST